MLMAWGHRNCFVSIAREKGEGQKLDVSLLQASPRITEQQYKTLSQRSMKHRVEFANYLKDAFYTRRNMGGCIVQTVAIKNY